MFGVLFGGVVVLLNGVLVGSFSLIWLLGVLNIVVCGCIFISV